MSEGGGERLVVAGLDLCRGSVLSREGAYYSISIVSREGVLYEAQELSLPKVLRILHEYRPRYLVLDNLYELAADKRDLLRVLSLLPPSTEIILATYDPVEGYRDLREVASKHGVYDSRRKPDPLETARILAQLGLMGVGFRVRVWEEKTKITVSRSRSSRAGGSSEDRYKRSSRAHVLRIVEKIRDALDSAGLTYDIAIRRSSGGVDRAVFIVNASREALKGVVRPMRGRYVRVSIRPVVRSILNLPQESMRSQTPIILGVDPGINYGIAAVDFSGRVLFTETVLGGDLSTLINRITRYGTPVVVATDKRPVPEGVRRIASVFGARVFEPEHTPTDTEKEEVVRGSGHPVGSTHERDALYAALMFYRKMSGKFNQIDRILSELRLDIDPVRIKAYVARGVDIATAIERIFSEALYGEEKRASDLVIKDFIREFIAGESRLRRLEEEYNKVLLENRILREKVAELSRSVEELQKTLEASQRELRTEVMRDREVSMLQEKIRGYQDMVRGLEKKIQDLGLQIEGLRKILRDVLSGRYVWLRRQSFRDVLTTDLAKTTYSLRDGRGDIHVLVLTDTLDTEALREIMKRVSRRRVLVLSERECVKKCYGDETEHVACIKTSEIGGVLPVDEWVLIERESLQRVLDMYREYCRDLPKRLLRSEEDLIRILEEYRTSREETKTRI